MMMMMNIARNKRQGREREKKKKTVAYYLPILYTLAEKQIDKLNVYLVIGRQAGCCRDDIIIGKKINNDNDDDDDDGKICRRKEDEVLQSHRLRKRFSLFSLSLV
jgi:hypothetical protein